MPRSADKSTRSHESGVSARGPSGSSVGTTADPAVGVAVGGAAEQQVGLGDERVELRSPGDRDTLRVLLLGIGAVPRVQEVPDAGRDAHQHEDPESERSYRRRRRHASASADGSEVGSPTAVVGLAPDAGRRLRRPFDRLTGASLRPDAPGTWWTRVRSVRPPREPADGAAFGERLNAWAWRCAAPAPGRTHRRGRPSSGRARERATGCDELAGARHRELRLDRVGEGLGTRRDADQVGVEPADGRDVRATTPRPAARYSSVFSGKLPRLNAVSV